MRLSQVALVAQDLEPVRQTLFDLLGLSEDFVDPVVGQFGLRNSVMAIGDTFLELVSPTGPATSAGRLLERRGGDGGYMVLAQVDALEPVSARVDALGIRTVWRAEREEVHAIHVHPRDIGAAIVSFDEMRPASEWFWAGPGWRDRQARNVSAITGVDIQAENPEAVARTWSKAFARSAAPDGDRWAMPLDQGVIRFEPALDGRGDGVAGIQLDVINPQAIIEAADRYGLKWAGEETIVRGTRLRFRGL